MNVLQINLTIIILLNYKYLLDTRESGGPVPFFCFNCLLNVVLFTKCLKSIPKVFKKSDYVACLILSIQ